MWGGRFEGTTDERVADFTRSIELDGALAMDDIAGSIAHVHGLGRAGLPARGEIKPDALSRDGAPLFRASRLSHLAQVLCKPEVLA